MPDEAPVLFTANRRATSAQFVCGNALLTTVLFYSAEFPNYQRIIPDMRTYPTRVTADRRSLLRACERARIFSTNLIYFHPAPDDTLTVTATANSGLLNEGQTFLNAQVTATEVTKIAFNPRYMIELLKALAADQVVLAFSGPGRPGVFYAADEADAWRDYIYVVMPLVQNVSEVSTA
jgi:DNA polymerase-3 subunit beta